MSARKHKCQKCNCGSRGPSEHHLPDGNKRNIPNIRSYWVSVSCGASLQEWSKKYFHSPRARAAAATILTTAFFQRMCSYTRPSALTEMPASSMFSQLKMRRP